MSIEKPRHPYQNKRDNIRLFSVLFSMVGLLGLATIGILNEIESLIVASFILFVIIQILNFKFIITQMEKWTDEYV